LAESGEYELLPREEVEMLKKEVERLKKHPFGELKEGETLLEAINNLNNSINKLIDIFTKAEADLSKDYSERHPMDDLKTIREQNEQIAQGLVAVADMIKDMKEEEKPLGQEPRIPISGSPISHSAPEMFQGEPSQIPTPPGPPPAIPSHEQSLPGKKRKGLLPGK